MSSLCIAPQYLTVASPNVAFSVIVWDKSALRGWFGAGFMLV